ncbi:MAG: hypothetical protein LR017_04125 [Candidatus Pacebacteria bacterium]|nr:hypothetical protein [Candidatus Paceibacterota bacterium]
MTKWVVEVTIGTCTDVVRTLIWIFTGWGTPPDADEFQWPEESEEICPYCGKPFLYYTKEHQCLAIDLHKRTIKPACCGLL